MAISRDLLLDLYIKKKLPVSNISRQLSCSQNKINYWLKEHKIEKRTISEAIYQLKNPNGDPFCFKKPINLEDSILFGLGLGIYWGEGSKKGSGGLRLTNTDIRMIKVFINFLYKFFKIPKSKLKFSLQVFGDISAKKCLEYWCKGLKVGKTQFYKTIVSEIRGKGTYRNKSEHGVVILYFNNVKLKKLILEMIEKIK